MAELLSCYFPADIQLHSYSNVHSLERKKNNWYLLDKFFKARGSAASTTTHGALPVCPSVLGKAASSLRPVLQRSASQSRGSSARVIASLHAAHGTSGQHQGTSCPHLYPNTARNTLKTFSNLQKYDLDVSAQQMQEVMDAKGDAAVQLLQTLFAYVHHPEGQTAASRGADPLMQHGEGSGPAFMGPGAQQEAWMYGRQAPDPSGLMLQHLQPPLS